MILTLPIEIGGEDMKESRNKLTINLSLGFLVVWGIVASPTIYLAQASHPAPPKPREMKLSVRNEQIYVGDTPYMLSSYDATGKTAGMGFLSLSADLRNTILYISDVPEKYDPPLGVQVKGGRTVAAFVVLRRKMCTTAFIDSEGVVFPDKVRQVDETGPSVTVKFISPNGNDVLLKDLVVQVKSRTGQLLRTSPTEGDMLIIKRVPREAIDITITSSASGGKWTGVLFPAYRSAKTGLVIYSLKNVSVGTEKKKEGQQAK